MRRTAAARDQVYVVQSEHSHVNAVVKSRPEEQGNSDDVDDVPFRAGQRHEAEVQQSAGGQCRERE